MPEDVVDERLPNSKLSDCCFSSSAQTYYPTNFSPESKFCELSFSLSFSIAGPPPTIGMDVSLIVSATDN